MKILNALVALLFPPRCHFCRRLLQENETDLCHNCRSNQPEFIHAKRSFPLIAQWTAVWYYKDKVRKSIQRFKFYNARGYAHFYAREMAIKLQEAPFAEDFDVLTWVPVSPFRRLTRGYDQAELLANALGKELHMTPIRALRKIRHTKPQSTIRDAAKRRANIMNAYKAENISALDGKHILLVDDVVTTGATASECAKTMLFQGATTVSLVAVAATYHHKK